MVKNHMENVTAIKGVDGFNKFTAFLSDRSIAIKTPCEGFAVIQLGPFNKRSEADVSAASLVLLEVGGEHPQHKHEKSDATFHFVNGSGNVILGENQERVPYSSGTILDVPRGMLHGFEPKVSGVMLAIQKGKPIIGEHGDMDIEYVDPRCFTEHGTVGG
jgi:quercetin dioxygenase-like cupin family protein